MPDPSPGDVLVLEDVKAFVHDQAEAVAAARVPLALLEVRPRMPRLPRVRQRDGGVVAKDVLVGSADHMWPTLVEGRAVPVDARVDELEQFPDAFREVDLPAGRRHARRLSSRRTAATPPSSGVALP